MQTIEDRLRTVVSLLPKAEQSRFAAPFAADESADSRLVDAVQTLARAEGLVCHTQAELARVKAKMLPTATRLPATPPAAENEATSLAARFAACKTPHAQTAFWRGLTPWERTVLSRAKPCDAKN
jgi:hypothetical protein